MTTVNIYLTFEGNCRDAFEFYQSVFGGEFSYVGTFRDMPVDPESPPIPEAHLDRVMHLSLPISKETILMGSDTGGEWASKVVVGNNFSISVNTDSMDKANQIFNALAANGQIIMPMNKTFWSSYFGMLTDQFGVNWMVSFELEADEKSKSD